MNQIPSEPFRVLTALKGARAIDGLREDCHLILLNLGPRLNQKTIDTEGRDEYKVVSSLREVARQLDDYANFLESKVSEASCIVDDDDEKRLLRRYKSINDFIEVSISRLEEIVAEACEDVLDDDAPRRLIFD
jgi:hypothetical protein